MKKISYLAISSLIIIEIVTLNLGINLNILKQSVGINSWLTVIIAYILGLIPLFLIIYISNYKKELPINEKITELFGKIPGTIINIFIALILFTLAITILHNVSNFTTSQFLFRTPIIISTVLLTVLAVYNCTKGINVISNVTVVLMCINFLLFIISFASLASEINLDNFFPILKENTSNIFITSLKITAINTLPLLTILIIPKDQITNPKKYNKAIIYSYIIGTLISLLFIVGAYGVLGPYLINTYEYPQYAVLKKVKLFGFLERIENIVSIQWIIGSYVYLTLIIYYISKNIKTNSQKKSNLTNIIIGSILVVSTMTIFKNSTTFYQYTKNIFPYIISPLIIIYIILTIKIFINKKKV